MESSAQWRDARRYMWPAAIMVPVLPFLSYGIVRHSGVAGWWWLTPALVFLIIPLVDLFGGDDVGNPPEEVARALQADRYYRWLTFLYLPLQFGGLALGCWQWQHGDLGWVGRLGVLASLGTVNGIAINTAHELGHKRESLERWLSKIALAPTVYGHFITSAWPPRRIRPARGWGRVSGPSGRGRWWEACGRHGGWSASGSPRAAARRGRSATTYSTPGR
jgi:alkane 1-monooxygenase